MGVCVKGRTPGPPPSSPPHHLLHHGFARPGTDQTLGEPGSRNWYKGGRPPLFRPCPLAAPSSPCTRRPSVLCVLLIWSLSPFLLLSSPPPSQAAPTCLSTCRLSLSVPCVSPAAAGRAGNGLSQGRCLDGAGRWKGGGARRGGGAQSWGGGGRGAHHQRPSESPAASGLAVAEPRGIPTPTRNPRHGESLEKPRIPGWEEEVLVDPQPRADPAPGLRTWGAAVLCLGRRETLDGSPLEVKPLSSRAPPGFPGRADGPPAPSTHNFPAFHRDWRSGRRT